MVQNQTEQIQLSIEGMTCAACVDRVQRALMRVQGVQQASVNLAMHDAVVTALPDVRLADLQKQVERAGYKALPIQSSAEPADGPEHRQASLRRRFLTSAPFALVVLLLGMFPMFTGSGSHHTAGPSAVNLIQLFCTLVVLYCGREFFGIAFKNALHFAADMNTLVSLGTGSAFLYSLAATLPPGWLAAASLHDVYYDSTAVVICLVLLGRWLEARATAGTSRAIRGLMSLRPSTAHKVSPDGLITDVAVDDLVAGDVVLVKPGEHIPADGRLAEGSGTVNQAMITGESLPVELGVGSGLIGGTLNAGGTSFTMRVSALGQQTVLARIIQAVRSAQATKAPVQRVADRIAGIFAPVVLALSLITFLGWYFIGGADFSHSLQNAVALLVIACPCAMGLAVPTAIIAATGLAAGKGILVRNVLTLEHAAKVDVVVFDKTGTLTQGQPEVQSLEAEPGTDPSALLQFAASVESHSGHPLAKGIVQYAMKQGIRLVGVDAFTETAGSGVQGVIEGRLVQVLRDTQSQAGVRIMVDGSLRGRIVLQDTLKPDAPGVVQGLHDRGIQTVMLTGDAQVTARAIAAAAGITTVYSQVLPADKSRVIAELQGAGHVVAMTGDGINDAPALAAADVGIAMGSGADIAMDTADVTLTGGNIARIADVIDISKRTIRIIRQNLFWAFVYNSLGIPLAAFGLLNPMIAGAAMAFSSVSVVVNSLRLRK